MRTLRTLAPLAIAAVVVFTLLPAAHSAGAQAGVAGLPSVTPSAGTPPPPALLPTTPNVGPPNVGLPAAPAALGPGAAPDGEYCRVNNCWVLYHEPLSSCFHDPNKGTMNFSLYYPLYQWRYNVLDGEAEIWHKVWVYNASGWREATSWWRYKDTAYAGFYPPFVFDEDNHLQITGGVGRPDNKRVDFAWNARQYGTSLWVIERTIRFNGLPDDPKPLFRLPGYVQFSTPGNIYCIYPGRALSPGLDTPGAEAPVAPVPPLPPSSESLPATSEGLPAPDVVPPGQRRAALLPMILRPAGGATPVPTPTPLPLQIIPPTPSGPGTANDLRNANFDEGRNVGWSEASSKGYTVVRQGPKGFTARSGEYLAWLGGVPGEVSSITQQVTVPASHPYLSLYLMASSQEDACVHDRATIFIDQYEVGYIGLCKQYNFHSWLRGQIDLKSFAGRKVALKIEVKNDDTLTSHLFLDDVTFESGVLLPPLQPTPTPAPSGASIRNPGFELGDNGDWSSATKSGTRNIFRNTGAHAGSWLGWLGGVDNEDGYIEQNLYIPPDRPYLTYWGWVTSYDTACGGDKATFYVGSTEFFAYNLCTTYNSSKWWAGWLNLTPYAGTTQKIRLRVQTNGTQLSSLYVDDFAFAAQAPALGSQGELSGLTLEPAGAGGFGVVPSGAEWNGPAPDSEMPRKEPAR